MCPKVKDRCHVPSVDGADLRGPDADWWDVVDRCHVPSVDGADGSNGSTAPAELARSLSASSMNEPPTSIDATKDSVLVPDPRPAAGGRTT